jgi:uncharacterized protein YbaR (Trm112 family)
MPEDDRPNRLTEGSDAIAAPERPGTDRRLLEILVCPATKGPLEYAASANELISRLANLAYPIRDGVPIMLPEEARPLDPDRST